MIGNLKKWYLAFGFQGAAFGSIGLVMSLFVVVALNGNVANASVVVALFASGNLVGSMFIGQFLDRYPRFFTVVFVSASADAVLSVMMGFTSSIYIYYAFSLILGVFSSVMGPAITTYLNKKLENDLYRKEINTMNMFNSIGVTIGTFAGGAWLSMNFSFASGDPAKMRWIFILGAILLAVSSFLGAMYLKRYEPLRIHKSKRIFPNTHAIADRLMGIPHNIVSPFKFSGFKPETKLYMFGIFTIFFGANMFFSIFSIYLKNVLNIQSNTIFMIYGINNVFTNVAYFFTNWAMKKFRDSSIVRTSLWTRVVMISAIALSELLIQFGGEFKWATIAAFMVIGFTWPFFYIPSTFQVTNLALPSNRGRIIGMFNTVINFGVIPASFISGYIALKIDYAASFAIGIVMLFLGERLLHRIATKSPGIIKASKAMREEEEEVRESTEDEEAASA